MTGAAIAEGFRAPRRTLQPVRKYSRPVEAGDAYFRPITQAQATLYVSSLRQFADGHMEKRAKGKRWGPLTPIDVRIFEVLVFRAMTWRTGKLDWSYVQIATAVRRSKQTVAESLRRLSDQGWLAWIRRFEPADDSAGPGGERRRGPQIKQATNAYRVMLPKKALAWLDKRRRLKAGPPPVDHEHARSQRADEIRDMERFAQAEASPAIRRAEAKIADQRRRRERES